MDDQDEPQEQYLPIEQMIADQFPDDRKQNRVMKEIVMLNQMDESYYDFQIEKVCTGLKIIVSLKPLIFSKNDIQKFNKGKPILIEIVLNENFPFDAPRIFCSTSFTIPSLADGRDILEDILEKPYISSILLENIISLMPSFFKKLIKNVYNFEFMEQVGDYYIGEQYDLEQFTEQSNLSLYEAKEIIQKKPHERILVLTDISLLSFSPQELQQSSQDKGFIGNLTNFYGLSMLKDIEEKQQNKQNVVVITWKTKDSQKKKSSYQETIYQFQKSPEFIEQIQKKLDGLGKSRLIGAKKQSFNQNEVTSKQFENMDIDQIIQNITLLESQLAVELSVSTINTLTNLYGKAIEFLSGTGDMQFQDFVNRMQDLLSREDIQAILQCEQEDRELQKEQSQRKKLNDSKKSPQQKAQSGEASIFDDVDEQQPQQQQQQGGGEVRNQSSSNHSNISSISTKSSIQNINLNLQDIKKYCFVETTEYNSGYQGKIFYDSQNKKKLILKTYNFLHLKQFFQQKNLIEELAGKNIFPQIFEINQENFQIVSENGQCSISDYYIKNKRKYTEEDLLILIKNLTNLAKNCYLEEQQKHFYPQIHPKNIVFIGTEQYREYSIRLFEGQIYDKEYPFINQSYVLPEYLEKIQDTEKQAQLTQKEEIQNVIYGIGRTIQRILLCGNKDFKNLFKKSEIDNFFENSDKKQEFPKIFEIISKILQQNEFENYDALQQLIEDIHPKENLIFSDQQGNIQHIFSHSIKHAMQKKVEQETEDRVSLAKKYQITNLEVLDTIDESLYPFLVYSQEYNLFMSQAFQQQQQKDLDDSSKETTVCYDTGFQKLEKVIEVIDIQLNSQEDLLGFDDDEEEEKQNQTKQSDSLKKMVGNVIEILKNAQNLEKIKEICEKQLEFSEDNKLPEFLETESQYIIYIQKITTMILLNLGFTENALTYLNNYKNNFINNSDQKQKCFQDNILEADLIGLEGLIYQLGFQDFKKAIQLFNQCYQTRVQIFGEGHPQTIGALYHIAECLKQNENYKEALAITEKIISKTTLLDQDSQNALQFLRFYHLQTKLQFNMKQYDTAWNSVQYTTDILKKYQGNVFKQSIETYYLVGNLTLYIKRNEKGLQYLQKAIQQTNQIVSSIHPFRAQLFEKVAQVQLSLQQYESAVKLQNEVLEIRKSLYGIHHKLTHESLLSLGNTFQDAGEIQEAQSYYQQTLDLKEKYYPEEQSEILSLYAKIQEIQIKLKKIEFAWEMIQNTETKFEAQKDTNPKIFMKFLERKQYCLVQLQQEVEATKISKQIMEIQKQFLIEDDQNSQLQYAQKILNVSFQLEKDDNQIEEAIKLKQQSIEIVKKFLGVNNIQIVPILRSISKNQLAQGKVEDSINTIVQGLEILKQNNSPEEDFVKLIKDLGNVCLNLMQSGEVEQAFAMNEIIQNQMLVLFGEGSPYLEFAAQTIETALNQAIPNE